MVQGRAAHFVTGDYRAISSVTQMLETLQWTEQQQRRKRAKVIMLYCIVNHLVVISPEPYITNIPRGVALTTRGHDTRFRLPYSRIQSPTIMFSNRNPSMERITNYCRNCLHLGRIQGQLPDSCHILDMPVLIVYTTTMAFNICTQFVGKMFPLGVYKQSFAIIYTRGGLQINGRRGEELKQAKPKRPPALFSSWTSVLNFTVVASLFWSDEINCCYTLGPVYCSLNPSKNLLLSSEATTWPGYPSKR